MKKIFIFIMCLFIATISSCEVRTKTLNDLKQDFIDSLNYGQAVKEEYDINNIKLVGKFNDGYVFIRYIDLGEYYKPYGLEEVPTPKYYDLRIFYSDADENVIKIDVCTHFKTELKYFINNKAMELNTAYKLGYLTIDDCYSIKSIVEENNDENYKIDDSNFKDE